MPAPCPVVYQRIETMQQHDAVVLEYSSGGLRRHNDGLWGGRREGASAVRGDGGTGQSAGSFFVRLVFSHRDVGRRFGPPPPIVVIVMPPENFTFSSVIGVIGWLGIRYPEG